MVLRPPCGSYGAEPFVTLSLSGVNALKLSSTPAEGPTPATETTKPTIAKADTSSKHARRHSLSPAVHSSALPRQRKNGSQGSSPTKNVRSSIITLKYKPTPGRFNADYDLSSDPPLTPARNNRGSAKPTLDGSVETISVDQSRRASTSSLTDNPTRSSGRARKLTRKAQALAGTKFYASAQSASDAGSPIDQAELGSESGQDEGNDAGQSGTITPTPTAIEHPIAETPVPSVEMTSIRSSTRERKPTARAVELEAEKSSRKRTRSPASAERASKVARTSTSASKKLSNLRYSTAILPDTPPPDSDDANTENEKGVKPADTVVIENSQTSSQPASVDDTVSVQSPTKAENNLSKPGSQPKSPPLTTNQSQDDPACDLTCLSPSFRLLALAQVASEWSDSEDSDENAEDDDALLESTDMSTADGDLALAKVRQLYCRCAHAGSSSLSTAQGSELSVRRTPPPETVQMTTSAHDMADNSKASTDTDATIRPLRTRTKPKARLRGPSTSKATTASDGPDRVSSNKRQGRRSSTRAQQSSGQQDAATFSYDSTPSAVKIPEREVPVSNVIAPHNACDELFKHQNTLTLASKNPRSDRIEATGGGESTREIKTTPVPSQAKTATKTSSKTGKSKLSKGGKGSAGGGIRLLLQHDQEREEQVPYRHGSTTGPTQAGSIKLRFTNGSK